MKNFQIVQYLSCYLHAYSFAVSKYSAQVSSYNMGTIIIMNKESIKYFSNEIHRNIYHRKQTSLCRLIIVWIIWHLII